VRRSDDSLPPEGPTLQRAFEALTATLKEQGVSYAIIGGMALVHHARVRATDHVDALLTVPAVALPRLFEALAQSGFRVEAQRNIREFQEAFFEGATWYADGRQRPHKNRNKTWNQYRLILTIK